MLTTIVPKLPMRNKTNTKNFYINNLGFEDIGQADFEDYLILKNGNIEIHFFVFKTLNILENYGQVYIRLNNIEAYYNQLITKQVAIHPNGALSTKPWGQKEFALLDPDNNLLTFGESI